MIKYDNLFYILNGGDTFKFNKKLIATLGIELCALTTYLIERALNREEKDELTEDGYFTLTDTDICLYSGLEAVRLSKIKKLGIEKSIFETKKVEGVEGTFYKPNLEKIFELMMSEKSVSELSYERIFKEERADEKFTKESLEALTFRDLRILCKKLNISFNGRNRKEELIDKILRNQENSNLQIEF
ncbi:MAG: Rho termination factor N-terminal domain-containing protein [Fusobacterium mortiferum]|nr:Rho termination factor N-terminal domain-containing protein [Fusobacterium mortiferum]